MKTLVYKPAEKQMEQILLLEPILRREYSAGKVELRNLDPIALGCPAALVANVEQRNAERAVEVRAVEDTSWQVEAKNRLGTFTEEQAFDWHVEALKRSAAVAF